MYSSKSRISFGNINVTGENDFPNIEQHIGSNLTVAPLRSRKMKISTSVRQVTRINHKTSFRANDRCLKKTLKRKKYNWQLVRIKEPIRSQGRHQKRYEQPLRYLKKANKTNELMFNINKDSRRQTYIPFPEVSLNKNSRIFYPINTRVLKNPKTKVPFPEVAIKDNLMICYPLHREVSKRNKDPNLRNNVPFPEVAFTNKQMISWPSSEIVGSESFRGNLSDMPRNRAIEHLVEYSDRQDKLPKLNLPIYDRLIHPRYPRIAKLIWILVFLACASCCFYNTGKCFKEFFYGTPQISVEFEKVSVMPIPSLTVCPKDIFGANKFTQILMSKYCVLPDNKDPRCIPPIQFTDINTTEILHPPEITVQDIWSSFNLSKMVVSFYRRCSVSRSDQSCLGPVSFIPKDFTGGNCLRIATQGIFKTWGLITEITGSADFRSLDVSLTNLDVTLRIIQHSQGEDITFIELDVGLFLPLFLQGNLRAFATQLTFQNTYMKPCRDEVTVEKCKRQCMETLLYSKIKCKLPFMTNNSLHTCNTSKNFAEAVDIMKQVLSMKQKCIDECPRSCVSYQFSYSVDILILRDLPILNFSVAYNDNNIRTIKEYYWYTFSLLLSDIGGNLGFFINVNLLTFVEIFELIFVIIESCFKRIKKQTKVASGQLSHNNYLHQQHQLNQNQKSYESSYGIVGFDRIFAENVSTLRKILWIIVISLSAVSCAFLIKHSINNYLYGDPDVTVLFELNATVKFPTFTVCPYKSFERYTMILTRKEMYTFEFNVTTEPNNIPLSELLRFENYTVTDIWREAGINMAWLATIDVNCLDLMQVSSFDVFDPPPARFSYTILGTCVSISLEQMIRYHGHSTGLCLTWKTFDFDMDNPFTLIMFIHNDEDDPRTLDLEKGLILEDQLLQLISMEFIKLEFITREGNPCADPESVGKCRTKCLDDLFEDKLPCKLPFMSNSSQLRYCSKPGEFNESMSIAIDIYNKKMMNDICDCPRKCKEYLITGLPDRNSMLKPLGIPLNIFYIYFTNNLFTLVQEHSRLNVNTLFSSICGSLGLFLGFCALSVLELIESIILILYRKLI